MIYPRPRIPVVLIVVALSLCASVFAAMGQVEPMRQGGGVAGARDGHLMERVGSRDSNPEVPDASVESLDVLSQRLSLSLDAFYAGVVRGEQERLANEEAARQEEAARLAAIRYSATPNRAPAMSGVGECTGFVIPDYIIQRESGGSSTAANPSGAYGCTQTLLSHYRPGGPCGDFDPYTIQGQRDCTYVLSDGGTNLRPWAF